MVSILVGGLVGLKEGVEFLIRFLFDLNFVLINMFLVWIKMFFFGGGGLWGIGFMFYYIDIVKVYFFYEL